MPLLLRTVEPTHVSRNTLPDRFPVQNDLEAVSNGTLSYVIRQLSSLSHHADELFTDLVGVVTGIAQRSGNLQARIDRLAVRVSQIDAVQEESASINESLNTKPFTSSLVYDQQVVSRESLPPSMRKTFEECDMPPPLDKLNKYRDDGKNGLKFYTDPSYFFDLWRQEMLKDTERAIDRGKKDSSLEPHKVKHDGQNRHKKRVRQPHNTRERQRHLAIEQGETLMHSASPDYRNAQNNQNHQGIEYIDGAPNNNYPSPADHQRAYSASRGASIEIMDQNNRSPHSGSDSAQRAQYEAYSRYYASQSVSSPSYESPNYRNSPIGTSRSNGTPLNGYRPSQPPPAPPPNYSLGTPPMNSPTSAPLPHQPVSILRNSASRSMPSHRETLPPPPPPPSTSSSSAPPPPHSHDSLPFPPPLPLGDEEPLPPPPPAPLLDPSLSSLRPPLPPDDYLPPSPPPPPLDDTPTHVHMAPPPPPPPPPMGGVGVGGGINGMDLVGGLQRLSPPKPRAGKAELRDGRDELLKSIRDGIALRKVETNGGGKSEEKSSTYHDVASILARRVAVEMSDSDSGSSEYDSDGWDEASN